MSEIFTNILTQIGQQKKAQAEATGTALEITTFKVGDSNGSYYQPNENQTALVNAKYTGSFEEGTQSQIVINPSASNEVLYKCFIPAEIGGFTIRELGLFDSDGDLILICKLPAQDKFSLASGLYQPLTFTPKIIYANPQTQAVLTPTSQIVPTTGEVVNIVETSIQEAVGNIEYLAPIIKNNAAISLQIDESLKLENGKLSVRQNLSTNFSINSGNTNNGDADILNAPGIGQAYQTLAMPTFSSNSQDSIIIYSSGFSSTSTYLAFDKNDGTFLTMNASPAVIDIEFPYTVKLSTLSLRDLSQYAASSCLSNFTVFSVNETNVETQIGYGSGFTENTPQNITATLTVVETKHIRIKIVGNPSGPASRVSSISMTGQYLANVSIATELFFKINDGKNGNYKPLTITYPDRTQEILTALSKLTAPSTNGVYTIIKEKNVASAIAVLSSKITQGKIFPTAPTEGNYHCLSAIDLQTYKYISGEWVEVQYVVIGSLIVSSGVISSVKTNPFNQNGYDVNIFSDILKYTNSFSSSGYSKLPNGLIIQWGNATYTTDWGPIYFPMTFPTACLSVVCSHRTNSDSSAQVATTVQTIRAISSAAFYLGWSGGSGWRIPWIAVGY